MPAHEIEQIGRGFEYLAIFAIFGPTGIFADIEYWPLLNADELAPTIEYWLDIERGNIIVRHSINQLGKTRNFGLIPAPTEMRKGIKKEEEIFILE